MSEETQRMSAISIWLLLLMASVLFQAPESVVALQGVHVIDGTGGELLSDVTIVLADGMIQSIGPRTDVDVPASATIIEGDGRYVIPGLFNLHGHVGVTEGLDVSAGFYSEANIRQELKRYLYYGVVAVASCGVDSDPVFPVRDDSRNSGFPGAHLFTAWRGIGFKGGLPAPGSDLGRIPIEVSTTGEARRAVQQVAGKGADFIKIWVDNGGGTLLTMPEEIYRTILNEATLRGLPVSSHTHYQTDVERLVRNGLGASIHGVADAPLTPDVIRLFESSDFTYIPTLTGYESRLIYAEGAPFARDPALTRAFSAAVVREVQSEEYRDRMGAGRDLTGAREQFEQAKENLSQLAGSGARIGLGSDHTPTRFPGYMEHRELELLAQAGLSPMQAIVAGTRNSAAHLGVSDWLGTLEPGKHGDFIVLDENPLDDIRNTRKIHMVFKGGVPVERDSLLEAFR